MIAPTDAAPRGRWLGLDALRGLTIAAMILVNNPGRWGAAWQYGPLRHADWHGCTFTDLVFPSFLFCAGVAIVPAFTKKLAHGAARGPLAAVVLRRVLLLVLLGLFLSAFPLVSFAADRHSIFDPILNVRFPGVLQRIGVCYGIAALLFLFTSTAVQRAVLAGCLLLYWPLITLWPVPGIGAPDLADHAATLHAFVDQAVFGSHVYKHWACDPEGLLSTIPALGTCLCGLEAGRVLARPGGTAAQLGRLGALGVAAMALGYGWSYLLPFNKPLWTSSYALWSAGIASVALGLLHGLAAGPGRRLLGPLQVCGVNALLVFVGSGVLGRLIGSVITWQQDGKPVRLQAWLFDHLFASWAAPKPASLLFALCWIGGWYLVLRALYRRGIVWKV
jgi:predicted acyltransferase